MPDLDISAEKVAFIILKAREFDTKVAPFDEGDQETSDEQESGDGALENRADDPSLQELVQFIEGLNQDEKACLVAISWIGRGTYEADDWETALRLAQQERNASTARYLIGDPLLPDYLGEGMAALGVNMAEIESEVASEG